PGPQPQPSQQEAAAKVRAEALRVLQALQDNTDPKKRAEGIEELRRHLQKEAAELERIRAELDRRMQALNAAMDKLHAEEAERAQEQDLRALRGAIGQKEKGPDGVPELERRLRDMEKKLDAVLREVSELRRELKGKQGGADARPRDHTPNS